MAAKPDLSQPELPAPDEKLLRPPTFWERYNFLKSVLIIALIIIGVDLIIYTMLSPDSPPPPQAVTPSPQATQANDAANWQSYFSQEGNFMFQYPPSMLVNENNTEPRSVKVVSSQNPQLEMTITYKTVPPDQSLPALIAQNKLCSEIVPDKGMESSINGQQKAELYKDTACGTNTKTVIYTLNDPMFYTITIDTPMKYDAVKPFVDQLIATLKFRQAAPTQPSSQSQPSEMLSACTMDAKVCPDGSAVGRTGPNCEFAPCPGF